MMGDLELIYLFDGCFEDLGIISTQTARSRVLAPYILFSEHVPSRRIFSHMNLNLPQWHEDPDFTQPPEKDGRPSNIQ